MSSSHTKKAYIEKWGSTGLTPLLDGLLDNFLYILLGSPSSPTKKRAEGIITKGGT
jgi:hypothetical protein